MLLHYFTVSKIYKPKYRSIYTVMLFIAHLDTVTYTKPLRLYHSITFLVLHHLKQVSYLKIKLQKLSVLESFVLK